MQGNPAHVIRRASRCPPRDRAIDFEQEIKEKDPRLRKRGAPSCAQQRVREVTALGWRQDIEVNFEDRHTLCLRCRAAM
jgi:hypothetical protein